MDRNLIMKDAETQRYFTTRFDTHWTKDYSEAYPFIDEMEIQTKLQHYKHSDYESPFEGKILIIETIYKIK